MLRELRRTQHEAYPGECLINQEPQLGCHLQDRKIIAHPALLKSSPADM